MSRVAKITMWIYALICVAVILAIPINRYEWMADLGASSNPCDLPLDPDGPMRAFLIASIVLAPWFPIAFLRSMRQRKVDASGFIGVCLFGFAVLRIFVLPDDCPSY